MIPICLAFHAHLPWRLRPCNYFDVGTLHGYFDDEGQRRRLARADAFCFTPAAALLARLLDRHPRFSFALSLSGPLLDQLEAFAPGRLAAFRSLVETGRAEPLCATSHHSLAFPVSVAEAEAQLRRQADRIGAILGRDPAVVGGEEPWDAEAAGALAAANGFTGMLIAGSSLAVPSGSAGRRVFRTDAGGFAVLAREAPFSDALAVGFSDRRGSESPRTPGTLDSAIAALPGDVLSLSVDLTALRFANSSDSGIFEFFERWLEATLSRPDVEFLTPSEVFARFAVREPLPSARNVVESSNELQLDARAHLASLEGGILSASRPELLEDYRRLTGSDHFEAMALRSGNGASARPDGFDSPYEAYMAFRHVLSDLERRRDGRPRTAPSFAGTAHA